MQQRTLPLANHASQRANEQHTPTDAESEAFRFQGKSESWRVHPRADAQKGILYCDRLPLLI